MIDKTTKKNDWLNPTLTNIISVFSAKFFTNLHSNVLQIMKKIEIALLAGLHKAAKQFVDQMGDSKVFAFYGEMGAGKTTLIKEICKALGVEENITSPTFALVNEYIAGEGYIYHFDCYRLNDIDEALNIGAEDYFYSGHICFIEWPERIEKILPDDTVYISINVEPNGSRKVIELT